MLVCAEKGLEHDMFEQAQYLQHVFGAEAAVHHAHLFQFALPNLSPSPMRYFEQVYKTSGGCIVLLIYFVAPRLWHWFLTMVCAQMQSGT